jgi:hypothetical protein
VAWWRRWLGRTESPDDRKRQRWRAAWAEAAARPVPAAIDALQAELDALDVTDHDVELEQEMLDGLRAALELAASLDADALPIVETRHRVIGTEACHFSAPASMPDDPMQPSGRVLVTRTRITFVGGASRTIRLHTVADVLRAERDVAIVRAGRDRLDRFRFNSYADALCIAMLVRRLI